MKNGTFGILDPIGTFGREFGPKTLLKRGSYRHFNDFLHLMLIKLAEWCELHDE